jgi:hypothetical protein
MTLLFMNLMTGHNIFTPIIIIIITTTTTMTITMLDLGVFSFKPSKTRLQELSFHVSKNVGFLSLVVYNP